MNVFYYCYVVLGGFFGFFLSFVLSHRFVLITSWFILKGTIGKSGHDVPFLTTQPGANREFIHAEEFQVQTRRRRLLRSDWLFRWFLAARADVSTPQRFLNTSVAFAC